jgi:uncharacterized protein
LSQPTKNSLIVTDAGPLIALSVANLLQATAAAFGTLLAPQAVIDECVTEKDASGTQAILSSIDKGDITVVATSETQHLDEAYLIGLGSGEVSVLAYAKQHGFVALIDEKRARKVAQRLSISVIGSGAVLVELKRKNCIPSVTPTLGIWRAHGYFLSEKVIADLLFAANEINS